MKPVINDTRRTGIMQRHFVANDETTAVLASRAATNALERAVPTDIDLIIIATTTPDNTFPSTATKVQHLIGAQGRSHLMYKPSVLDLFTRLMLPMPC